MISELTCIFANFWWDCTSSLKREISMSSYGERRHTATNPTTSSTEALDYVNVLGCFGLRGRGIKVEFFGGVGLCNVNVSTKLLIYPNLRNTPYRLLHRSHASAAAVAIALSSQLILLPKLITLPSPNFIVNHGKLLQASLYQKRSIQCFGLQLCYETDKHAYYEFYL